MDKTILFSLLSLDAEVFFDGWRQPLRDVLANLAPNVEVAGHVIDREPGTGSALAIRPVELCDYCVSVPPHLVAGQRGLEIAWSKGDGRAAALRMCLIEGLDSVEGLTALAHEVR
jgi:hypothetical protein